MRYATRQDVAGGGREVPSRVGREIDSDDGNDIIDHPSVKDSFECLRVPHKHIAKQCPRCDPSTWQETRRANALPLSPHHDLFAVFHPPHSQSVTSKYSPFAVNITTISIPLPTSISIGEECSCPTVSINAAPFCSYAPLIADVSVTDVAGNPLTWPCLIHSSLDGVQDNQVLPCILFGSESCHMHPLMICAHCTTGDKGYSVSSFYRDSRIHGGSTPAARPSSQLRHA